jgi:S1-C subfamily serine protease
MSCSKSIPGLVLLLLALGAPACGGEERRATSTTPEEASALDAVMPQLRPGDIRPGDILTSVAGRPVRSRADARRAVEGAKPGDVIELGIDRGGERITLKVATPR